MNDHPVNTALEALVEKLYNSRARRGSMLNEALWPPRYQGLSIYPPGSNDPETLERELAETREVEREEAVRNTLTDLADAGRGLQYFTVHELAALRTILEDEIARRAPVQGS